MALKSFGRGRDGDDDLGGRPASQPVAPGGLTAFIDQGSEFEGKLSFRDTVRIDGRFRGEIAAAQARLGLDDDLLWRER